MTDTIIDPDVFFDKSRESEAKALCASCPLERFTGCRQAASDRMEPFGVYGGENGHERLGRLINEAGDNVAAALWDALALSMEEGDAVDAANWTGIDVKLIRKYTPLRGHRKYVPMNNGKLHPTYQKALDREVRIRDMAAAGFTAAEIADAEGCSIETVRLRAKGVPGFLQKEVNQAKGAKLWQALDSGETLRAASRRLGIVERTAQRWATERRKAMAA